MHLRLTKVLRVLPAGLDLHVSHGSSPYHPALACPTVAFPDEVSRGGAIASAIKPKPADQAARCCADPIPVVSTGCIRAPAPRPIADVRSGPGPPRRSIQLPTLPSPIDPIVGSTTGAYDDRP